jgi:peptidoglycan-N-acetylglucosamine deacetylase
MGIYIIHNVTAQKARGWRAPLYDFSDASAKLLIEEGFIYDASLPGDDIP